MKSSFKIFTLCQMSIIIYELLCHIWKQWFFNEVHYHVYIIYIYIYDDIDIYGDLNIDAKQLFKINGLLLLDGKR
jgi:hypothetical protein